MDTKPFMQRGWSKVLVKRLEEGDSAVTVLCQFREEKPGTGSLAATYAPPVMSL